MNIPETPHYIIQLKDDLINHIDASMNDLVLTINKTVALKEDLLNFATKDDLLNFATKDDLKNLATKDDISLIWDNMATKEDISLIWENMATKNDIKDLATKTDINKINALIGSYEVRSKNIEDILLDDHKPRIIDLEKVVYSN